MKKMILLSFAGVALFAFIFTASILWYGFFYVDESNKKGNVNSFEVQLGENDTINESGLIPLDDETAKSLTPYIFRVENTNDNDFTYNILIEDAIISDDANYANKDLLSRAQLRYQLTVNGNLVKMGNLSDIKNNILDTRSISALQVNNYELRVYVAEPSLNTDWQNKYYHFNIKVQMEDDK